MTEVTFGPFRARHRCRRDCCATASKSSCGRRRFHALRTLLRHSGQSIGYEQMMAEAWEGTFVSRHTVDVTIGEVRKSLGEYGRWITHRPKVGYCLEVPTSEELVRKGWHFWNRRTREGAERAIDCFQQAAARMPRRLPRVRRTLDLLPDAGDVRDARAARGVRRVPRRARARRRRSAA